MTAVFAGGLRSVARHARSARWLPTYLSRRPQVRRAAAEGTPPHVVFGDSADEFWFWANSAGRRQVPSLRSMLPGLPDERLQRKFTGASGDVTLREADRFYRLVKEAAGRHRPGGLAGCRAVLEFGCGWGRVLRFFLKDLDGGRLLGVDCLPDVVEVAQAHNRWARFELVAPLPPTGLPDGGFDLVYCYSVFSHLSEKAHLAWLDEFSRLVPPGGLLVATTRPRSFILRCAELRDRQQRGERVRLSGALRAFEDTGTWLDRYDAGQLCHEAVGGRPGLDDTFYGETAIPRAYVEHEWPSHGFELIDYISDREVCGQDVFIARRG